MKRSIISFGIYKDAVDRLYNNYKSTKPVVMGLVGSTLRSGNYQVLWGAAFLGWNVKWIRGYTGTADLRQPLERGEIDMTTFGASKDSPSSRTSNRPDTTTNTASAGVFCKTSVSPLGRRRILARDQTSAC
jgi:hypothetical protein